MLSKTVIAAAAFATAVAAYDLPSCWTSCFEKYEVDSEGCLCKDSLGSVVSSCIDSGCSSANATAYSAWLASYCHEAPVSSNTWAVPSSTYAIPSSVAPPPYTTTEPAWSTPVESQPATYPAQSESWTAPVESSPTGYTSECTGKSTTLIWRSSTAVVPVTTAPGGGWGPATTYPAGNATGAVTTGGSWPEPSGIVPATGGAMRVGAGLAAIGAGVAAILL